MSGLNLEWKNYRINDKLKSRWQRLSHGHSFPEISDIDNKALKEYLDHCVLIKADNSCIKEDDYKVMSVGNKIKQSFFNDFDESALIGIRIISNNKIYHLLDKVLSTKTYVEDSGITNIDDENYIKYRQILLPFGKDKYNIGAILCGITYKIFKHE